MMRRIVTASALAVAALVGGSPVADARTGVSVDGPRTVTRNHPFTVTAKGGTDTAGMRVRLCVAKRVGATLQPRACRDVGHGSISAHPREGRPGTLTYVAVAYSRIDGHVLSTSSPITVRVR